MAIEVGTRAGKYELVQPLGAGGFGLVFLARDHELGRDLALKFLRPEHTGSAEHVQRFLQEARAAARIQHPGIVTVFECGELPRTGSAADGLVYIAMELLRGEPLSARLLRGALPVTGAVTIARQIAAAVEAAHRIGIVHRDLKPENVFLVPDPETVGGERVKVLDFGIAKLGEASAAAAVATGAHMILGSPHYMSPEQCRSTARVDARTDVYSLGVILFEMLAGERPFSDPDVGGLLAMHQLVPPPRLRDRAPGVPDVLGELVERMLAKSPDARPQSMEVVQRVLEPFRASMPHAAQSSQPLARAAVSTPPAGAPLATERVRTEAALVPAPSAPAARRSEPSPRERAPQTEAIAKPRIPVLVWAVGGAVAIAIAVTIGALASSSGGGSGSPATKSTPAQGLEPDALSPEALRGRLRAALERRDQAALGALLSSTVFAVGPDAEALASGPAAVQKLMAKHLVRIPDSAGEGPMGSNGDVAWWIDADRRMASSAIAVREGYAWRIGGWKLSYLVSDPDGRRLSEEGRLPEPAAVSRGALPAAPAGGMSAFRTAVSSRASFVAALSTRPDRMVMGTAPGQRLRGEDVLRLFKGYEISPRGAFATGRIYYRAAWGAANLDFNSTSYGRQIYRVFVLLLEEDGRWTIPLAHFSNAGPIPGR